MNVWHSGTRSAKPMDECERLTSPRPVVVGSGNATRLFSTDKEIWIRPDNDFTIIVVYDNHYQCKRAMLKSWDITHQGAGEQTYNWIEPLFGLGSKLQNKIIIIRVKTIPIVIFISRRFTNPLFSIFSCVYTTIISIKLNIKII